MHCVIEWLHSNALLACLLRALSVGFYSGEYSSIVCVFAYRCLETQLPPLSSTCYFSQQCISRAHDSGKIRLIIEYSVQITISIQFVCI